LDSQRLRSILLVETCMRMAESAGRPIAVLHRGDADAGSVFIKVYSRNGLASLFGQSLSYDGKLIWRNVLSENSRTEESADERIANEIRVDRDIWVLEVLDDSLQNPLTPEDH
jgi:hypothetical protein